MRVIGTAGHVDHGKSTLVRALSGIDPDRLKEEKVRGLTIELGFAWIELPTSAATETGHAETTTVGIVDVPGHIDFIKNMLAGVGSIDAATLIIAADEGVMPQTREHLAILDLLAVPSLVVALTKVDLIDDPEWLELVELDIVQLLEATRHAGAPIIPVSAMSGQGLDDLRTALSHALAQLPARRDRARPRLPIDRVFSLSGFGTVVTGTLSDGGFAVGDSVEILPSGRPARIRGLQSYKHKVETGRPGSRLAVNLSGVSVDEIQRGDVLCKPNTLRPTLLVDVEVHLLADAPKPLLHNQAVDFFSGATEIPAHVRLLGTEQLLPGEHGWLQLRLERPAVLAQGDRYILRQPSPSRTLGGGTILDPHPRRRWRRFNPAVIQRLVTLASGAPDEILLQTLDRHPLISETDLIGRSGLGVEPAQVALADLRAAGAVLALAGGKADALITAGGWQQLLDQLHSLLVSFHAQFPLRPGMPRGEARNRMQAPTALNSRIDLPVRLFNTLVERAAEAGLLAADENNVWLADFQVRLTPAQQQAVDRTLSAFAAAGFSPPNEPETLALLGGDQALFDSLVERGELVRLAGNVYFLPDQFAAMTGAIREFLGEHGAITLAEARDLLGTSRKYIQAILEELDARRITRREGDARVLR